MKYKNNQTLKSNFLIICVVYLNSDLNSTALKNLISSKKEFWLWWVYHFSCFEVA